MSLSQFHCTSRLYLDMHGLIFETSICYWQDQPGRPPVRGERCRPRGRPQGAGPRAGGGPESSARCPGSVRCDSRPSLACRVAGSRACYRGCENRGLFRSCLCVSPEGQMRHSEGSRDELPEAPPGPRARNSSHGARPTAGGPGNSPSEDCWGRRGVSVSLGRGRPRRDARRRASPRAGSSAPGRARKAVSSVRRAQWPAGPSQEAGYDCQSVGEWNQGLH